MDLPSLAWRTDLALLRLSGSEVEERGDALVVRTPANPAFHWGNFVLLRRRPGPGDAERLLAEFAATFPEARHRAFGLADPHAEAADLAPLAAAGLEVGWSSVLTAGALVPPERPNREVTLRPLSGDDDWAQRVALAVACSDVADAAAEAGYADFAARRAAAERALVEAGHGTWLGAFEGDRLVASLGLFRTGSGLARYQEVETHPDRRRRGIAATLVHAAGRAALEEPEVRALVIVADPDDAAIRIYRRLGFADAERQVTAHRG